MIFGEYLVPQHGVCSPGATGENVEKGTVGDPKMMISLYRSSLTEGYPRSCQGNFHQIFGVSQLLCCQRKQVDFLHEKGFLVAEHRDTYMDEVPKKIPCQKGSVVGPQRMMIWWHWMVFDNISQFSRARVDACRFSYNRAEGEDLVVLHKVISSDKMLLIPKTPLSQWVAFIKPPSLQHPWDIGWYVGLFPSK